MKNIGKVIGYTAAVVIVSCLVAPPLYWLGRWAVETDLLPQLKSFRFPKYFNRAFLVVAVASLWPFLRWMGLRRWTELELSPNPRRLKDLGTGIGIAVVGLWLVALFLVGTDFAAMRVIRFAKVWPIVLTAIVVPLIEEPIFRGALFGLLRRALSWKWALAFLSFFFAILHFVKPQPGSPRIRDVRWYSGFELFSRVFWQLGEVQLVVGGLVTLLLVGWILGYTVVKTRSLYMAIGLHGGWVFALRSFDQLSKRRWKPSIWLGRDVSTGLIPVLLLLITLVVVIILLRRRQQQPPSRDEPAEDPQTPAPEEGPGGQDSP